MKFSLNEKYEIPFDWIFVNRVQEHVSTQAEIVITTKSLKYHMYTKMNQRLEDIMGQRRAKN